MKVDDLAPKWLGCFWKIYQTFTEDHCMAVNCQVFWTWKWQAKSRIGVIKSSNHDQVARSHLDLHKLHHELTSHLWRVLRYWWSCCRLSTSTYLWVDVVIPYSAGISWSSFWLTLQVIWTSKFSRREIKNMLYNKYIIIYYINAKIIKHLLSSCITFLGVKASKALRLLIFDITKLHSTRAT